MKNNKRTVNRNLINALIAYKGLTLKTLGRMCAPPVTNAALCMLLADKFTGDRLVDQMAEILLPSANDLFRELEALQGDLSSEVLFPHVDDKQSPFTKNMPRNTALVNDNLKEILS